MQKTILVTGGAGYIGSHTAWLLYQHGYHVIIIDALLHHQTWPHSWATFFHGDIADQTLLDHIFTTYTIHAVMHFAAFIEVGRSVHDPAGFYENNVTKTIQLLQTMRRHNVLTFIFSSSCAVYGTPQWLPLTEEHPKNPISPYGKTKSMVEELLADFAHAYNLNYVALRYFNAAGGLPDIGLCEHHEPETHAIPLLLRAAINKIPFTLFGDNHATPDGSCIRDYVHVADIAQAHVHALNYLDAGNPSIACNLGTGTGVSVKELITTVAAVTGAPITVVVAAKRAGDPAVLVANATLAQQTLSWQPQHSDLKTIIQSAYLAMFANKHHNAQGHVQSKESQLPG